MPAWLPLSRANGRLPACACPFAETASSLPAAQTHVYRYECMIPLHELMRHVGCHSSRRPESLSGRNFVRSRGEFPLPPAFRSSCQYAGEAHFVPALPFRSSFCWHSLGQRLSYAES